MSLKPINLSRCAHFHAAFPSNSIVLYNQEKSLCKISLQPIYIADEKFYIKKAVGEKFYDFGLVPNLDHSIIFRTKKATWTIVRNECHQRNALFYFPPNKGLAKRVANLFDGGYFHVGLRLKGEIWVTDAGNELDSVYWDDTEPNGDGYEKCAYLSTGNLIKDCNCDEPEFNGLCIQ